MKFGKFDIEDSLIIYESKYTFAFLSIQPILKYHVLVCPKRVIKTYSELSIKEVIDFSETVSHITLIFRTNNISEASLCNIQDGAAAGQCVPHLHMHILPRREGDFTNEQIISFNEKEFDEQNINFINKTELLKQSNELKVLLNFIK